MPARGVTRDPLGVDHLIQGQVKAVKELVNGRASTPCQRNFAAKEPAHGRSRGLHHAELRGIRVLRHRRFASTTQVWGSRPACRLLASRAVDCGSAPLAACRALSGWGPASALSSFADSGIFTRPEALA
jgi:hypothetical protein